MRTFLAYCFAGGVCVECFPHHWMGLHKCQVLITWSFPRPVEPLERKFRNLKCPSLKVFAELAWLKETKGFEECQTEDFSLWCAVRASWSLSGSLFRYSVTSISRFLPFITSWHVQEQAQIKFWCTRPNHNRPQQRQCQYLLWGHRRVHWSDYKRSKLLKGCCHLTLSAGWWRSWRWTVGEWEFIKGTHQGLPNSGSSLVSWGGSRGSCTATKSLCRLS